MKKLRYDVISASISGVTRNPLAQMNSLGYIVIAAVPQTIGDQWWFTVENYIEPLPNYLEKIEFEFGK